MNKQIIFIDDEKLPEWFGLSDKTLHAKSYAKAVKMIKNEPMIVYLDHDLGPGLDGSQLLLWICEFKWIPIKVYCISLNPVGMKRIENACKDYDVPFENIGMKKMFDKFGVIDGQSG